MKLLFSKSSDQRLKTQNIFRQETPGQVIETVSAEEALRRYGGEVAAEATSERAALSQIFPTHVDTVSSTAPTTAETNMYIGGQLYTLDPTTGYYNPTQEENVTTYVQPQQTTTQYTTYQPEVVAPQAEVASARITQQEMNTLYAELMAHPQDSAQYAALYTPYMEKYNVYQAQQTAVSVSTPARQADQVVQRQPTAGLVRQGRSTGFTQAYQKKRALAEQNRPKEVMSTTVNLSQHPRLQGGFRVGQFLDTNAQIDPNLRLSDGRNAIDALASTNTYVGEIHIFDGLQAIAEDIYAKTGVQILKPKYRRNVAQSQHRVTQKQQPIVLRDIDGDGMVSRAEAFAPQETQQTSMTLRDGLVSMNVSYATRFLNLDQALPISVVREVRAGLGQINYYDNLNRSYSNVLSGVSRGSDGRLQATARGRGYGEAHRNAQRSFDQYRENLRDLDNEKVQGVIKLANKIQTKYGINILKPQYSDQVTASYDPTAFSREQAQRQAREQVRQQDRAREMKVESVLEGLGIKPGYKTTKEHLAKFLTSSFIGKLRSEPRVTVDVRDGKLNFGVSSNRSGAESALASIFSGGNMSMSSHKRVTDTITRQDLLPAYQYLLDV